MNQSQLCIQGSLGVKTGVSLHRKIAIVNVTYPVNGTSRSWPVIKHWH